METPVTRLIEPHPAALSEHGLDLNSDLEVQPVHTEQMFEVSKYQYHP
jgi:hypothetical protein